MNVATMEAVPRPEYPSFALPSLYACRYEAGLSMAELARRARITPQTILRLETGQNKAQRATVRKLARALGVKPADLMAEPEPADEDTES